MNILLMVCGFYIVLLSGEIHETRIKFKYKLSLIDTVPQLIICLLGWFAMAYGGYLLFYQVNQ